MGYLPGSIPIFQQIDATSGSLTNDTSSRGNEIQVARTLDGKHLVAKWIDFVPYMIDDQETQVSDIFVSVYDIEKGTWSEKRNVTRDNEFDKLTWLPQTLPNIKEIPVLSIVTNSTNTPGTQDYLNDQLRIDLECSVVSKKWFKHSDKQLCCHPIFISLKNFEHNNLFDKKPIDLIKSINFQSKSLLKPLYKDKLTILQKKGAKNVTCDMISLKL